MDVTAKATTTIRTRLLRILILALAVLLTLLGVAAAEQISAYRNASATDQNARLEITQCREVKDCPRASRCPEGSVCRCWGRCGSAG
ncbi:hypothetical protein AB0N07_43930, partial [Streptomyces sp. NPDC051172]|uniref:hypothetical protein n=1 Tax=Streptomyces sp. NPDC051172 TaxID=3155796 RepID=UPI00343F0094